MTFASTGNFGLSFVLELVALAIVILVVVRKVLPPLRSAMAKKTAEISAQLSAGEETRAAAAALVAERTAALEAARTEAAAIVAQARRGAQIVATDGERAAEEEYERIVHRAQAAIEATRGAVIAGIMAQVGRLVLAAATEVVEAELGPEAQHRLIDEAITATEAEVH